MVVNQFLKVPITLCIVVQVHVHWRGGGGGAGAGVKTACLESRRLRVRTPLICISSIHKLAAFGVSLVKWFQFQIQQFKGTSPIPPSLSQIEILSIVSHSI